MKYQKVVFHILQKMFKSETKEKKDNFTDDNHTVFEIGSCNYCTLEKLYIYVSYMFLSNFKVNIHQKCQQRKLLMSCFFYRRGDRGKMVHGAK